MTSSSHKDKFRPNKDRCIERHLGEKYINSFTISQIEGVSDFVLFQCYADKERTKLIAFTKLARDSIQEFINTLSQAFKTP